MIEKLTQLQHFLGYAVEQFQHKRCQQSAAALTYMTLFAIVPLMTVTYSMFSVIPAFQGLGEQLQAFIFSHFVPDTGQEVQQYLSKFSTQARELSAVGIAILVVTAYFMLKNIERGFNTIWGLTEGRKGMSGFLLYWAVLSLGPLLLGLGLVMSTYLLSLRFLVSEYDNLGLVPGLLVFFPWVLSGAAFTLLFAAVPNCRVPLRDALIGGLVTAVCFELFKDLFGFIVSHTSFSAIYGAFAFAPLFLLWIYILWMIVLCGAVLVRALSSYRGEDVANDYPDLVAALILLWPFQQCQASGDGVGSAQLAGLALKAEQRARIFDRLLQHKVIAATQKGDFVLSRDLHRLTLLDLAQLLEVYPPLPEGVGSGTTQTWLPTVIGRLRAIEQCAGDTLDVRISDLFDPQVKSELASVADIDGHLGERQATDTPGGG